jgi:DNA-binding MarR family transcriptional regulator
MAGFSPRIELRLPHLFMLDEKDYRDLAEFRYQMRRFLRISEDESRKAGIEPQQYLVLIATKGMPQGMAATLTNLAERLQLKHNSVVELVDRCVERGLVLRATEQDDRRTVVVQLTPEGEATLEKLAIMFHKQLRQLAPELVEALHAVLQKGVAKKG